MRKLIPSPVIAVVAEIVSERETHASLDSLFMYAGAPGDPPEGSKHVKALEWLRSVNKDLDIDPLTVLGLILENYLEEEFEDPIPSWHLDKYKQIEKLKKVLERANFRYLNGGKFVGSFSSPVISLEEQIRKRNIESLNIEFERAIENLEAKPREALSAACNILESVFKIFIEEEGLTKPKKLDLGSTWKIVRDGLNLDPSKVEERDLKEILSGIAGIVSGVGAFRTHASSAHGAGKKVYRVEPRHARLAVHSAHTIALFVLESWEAKK